jgi:hypothetical protein
MGYKGKMSYALVEIYRAPDNFQVQRVITPYFWKWWVFALFVENEQEHEKARY